MSDKNIHKKKSSALSGRKKIFFISACTICAVLLIYGAIRFFISLLGFGEPARYTISGTGAIPDTDAYSTSSDDFNIYDNILVCLDAGHGGYDSGAVGENERKESDDVLRMTLILKDKLESLGIPVLLTRDSDEFIELSERCSIANNANASLMLSIHRNNYSQDAKVCGVEAWIASSCPDEDYDIAEKILNSLSGIDSTVSRGVRHGTRDDDTGEDYAINNMSSMPSLILEMGYMSNTNDNTLFDNNIDKYCESIAYTIADWFLNK